MKLDHESVFIYPTDTVWGIGASIYSEDARNKISDIKGSAENKPLSIMFTDVNRLFESFNLPKEITLQWLKDFFKLESTFGIPLTLAKINIPAWVTKESEFVSVRCLELQTLKEIGDALHSPFFTTSLNLTGQAPITSYAEAMRFQKSHAPNIPLFGDATHNLSGQSSTIVFLKDATFRIIRSGQKIEEIKKHLGLVGYSIT
jgi:L-threonylcarbamoyladenylate synthase